MYPILRRVLFYSYCFKLNMQNISAQARVYASLYICVYVCTQLSGQNSM